ncbi:MAG: hypothetical protein FJ280_25600 [Planctomycetes bacterium]|nr:hypothetical protein [Planctomycetota bacterium]
MKERQILLIAILSVAVVAACSFARTVTPMIGGGQVSAPMVHVGVFYDYAENRMSVDVDTSLPMPAMRPLAPGDEFDPAQPWSVLSGKAYDFQYGWIAGGYFVLPEGAAVWVELLSQSPGLETYRGNKDKGGYLPIFGTAGSSLRWKWPGVMTHNTYAVRNPADMIYSATYRVYFGDSLTGDPVPAYDCTTVTLWLAVRGDPRRAWDPKPSQGASSDAEESVPLTWRPGDNAVQHDVYLGTDANTVASADASDTTGIYRGRQVIDANSYVPEDLEWGQTYYWRIDEIDKDRTVVKGTVWRFTVTDFLVVDDPTGKQSMSWTYDNTTTPFYSEVCREWATPQDWSRQAIKTLSVWFRGHHDNGSGMLYVVLQDATGASAAIHYADPSVVTLESWWQ